MRAVTVSEAFSRGGNPLHTMDVGASGSDRLQGLADTLNGLGFKAETWSEEVWDPKKEERVGVIRSLTVKRKYGRSGERWRVEYMDQKRRDAMSSFYVEDPRSDDDFQWVWGCDWVRDNDGNYYNSRTRRLSGRPIPHNTPLPISRMRAVEDEWKEERKLPDGFTCTLLNGGGRDSNVRKFDGKTFQEEGDIVDLMIAWKGGAKDGEDAYSKHLSNIEKRRETALKRDETNLKKKLVDTKRRIPQHPKIVKNQEKETEKRIKKHEKDRDSWINGLEKQIEQIRREYQRKMDQKIKDAISTNKYWVKMYNERIEEEKKKLVDTLKELEAKLAADKDFVENFEKHKANALAKRTKEYAERYKHAETIRKSRERNKV